MRVRTIVLIIVALLIAMFLFINWQVFAAPASFYFLVGTVAVPIGVVIVGLLAVVTLGFAGYVAVWQGSLLMDYRRQSKELQTQRSLADDAEASRFTALSALLREEMAKQNARFDEAITALRTEVRDTEHSIAATLAEMDDRLLRATNRSAG
jgi:uncharacterized integral membrane protein